MRAALYVTTTILAFAALTYGSLMVCAAEADTSWVPNTSDLNKGSQWNDATGRDEMTYFLTRKLWGGDDWWCALKPITITSTTMIAKAACGEQEPTEKGTMTFTRTSKGLRVRSIGSKTTDLYLPAKD